jgi:hypothetical protein
MANSRTSHFQALVNVGHLLPGIYPLIILSLVLKVVAVGAGELGERAGKQPDSFLK